MFTIFNPNCKWRGFEFRPVGITFFPTSQLCRHEFGQSRAGSVVCWDGWARVGNWMRPVPTRDLQREKGQAVENGTREANFK